jgi:hypothetical protein
MRLLLIAAFLLMMMTGPQAECVCRCVEGEMQPICESAIDLRPLCPVTVCALPLPLARPIQPPVLPPLGTTKCTQRQVLDRNMNGRASVVSSGRRKGRTN